MRYLYLQHMHKGGFSSGSADSALLAETKLIFREIILIRSGLRHIGHIVSNARYKTWISLLFIAMI